MIECNHTSVGIFVYHDDKILMIERRNMPYGIALPAGHVDLGEDYTQAAYRELKEEVGLVAKDMKLLLVTKQENQCRRPGGSFHHWQVFQAICDDPRPVRSQDETKDMRWVSRTELDELTIKTVQHLKAGSGPDEWRADPGLEPVWMHMMMSLSS
jgi:ADP-ribose pyrophosphatase YjhB (NUDIX family)